MKAPFRPELSWGLFSPKAPAVRLKELTKSRGCFLILNVFFLMFSLFTQAENPYS